MLRNFFRNNKGQNTAEYALLIALVVAGVIAMQTYAQRSLQARMRDAGHYLTSTSSSASTIGRTEQYEPYYLKSQYDVTRDTAENKMLSTGLIAQESVVNRARAAGGVQKSTYTYGQTEVPEDNLGSGQGI